MKHIPLYICGSCACSCSAVALSGCVCMLSAFSMDRTLKRKGRSPFTVAGKRLRIRSPNSEGLLCKTDAKDAFEGSLDGEVGCVPIQSWQPWRLVSMLGRGRSAHFGVRLVVLQLESRIAGCCCELRHHGAGSTLSPVILLRCWNNFEDSDGHGKRKSCT